MQPWTTLGVEGPLTLRKRGDEYAVFSSGLLLMGSRRHGSEEALAQEGLRGLSVTAPAVLIGGLGFGYTLRAALDELPSAGRVVVVELAAAIVEWNRGPLGPLAGHPLADERVTVRTEDVAEHLAQARAAYDVILLDVDNGPFAVTHPNNTSLYEPRGLHAAKRALKPNGRLVVWSAADDERFLTRLASAGFHARTVKVAAAKTGRAAHVLFVAERR